MDDQAFRARMGPALDELDAKLVKVLDALAKPRVSRRVLAGIVSSIGATIAVIAELVNALAHSVRIP